ncbi:MAG: hypothetical protein JWN74_3768 [Acidobacteriaceae bacterium]|nr:hypothetical protein [Acidobacteriaceae bacterium]
MFAIVLSSLFAMLGCGASGGSNNGTPPPALVSIAVTAPNTNLIVGQTEQLAATGKYSDKTTKDLTGSVTWNTSPAGLATVATTGMLTAQSSGKVSITATMSSVSGSFNLTIAPKLVSIAITPASATIAASTKQQFVAKGTYSDNTTQIITGSVTWSSSNTAFAAISDTSPTKGLATGVSGPGTTTITATSGAITSAPASLTVTAATATSLAITPNPASMGLFVSQQFTATAQFSDGTSQDITNVATWSSSSTQSATITASGLVTAKQVTPPNTPVTISATFESVSASTPLTIDDHNLVSIAISLNGSTAQGNGVIAQGTKVQLAATGTFIDGSTHNLTSQVAWSSSDTSGSIIQFLPGSTVQGVAPGQVTITATLTSSTGSISGSIPFQVTNAAIQAVSVTPSKATVPIGGRQSLTATGQFSDGTTQDITTSAQWTASLGAGNTVIATVGSSGSTYGVALGQSQGTTTISATFGAITGTTPLTVTGATLRSIKVAPTRFLLAPGSTHQYTAIGTWTDGSTQPISQNVTWSETDVSGTSVALVSGSGVVTGWSAGTATVTAVFGSLAPASANVVVEGSPLSCIGITPQGVPPATSCSQVTPPSVSVPETIQFSFIATGIFADGTPLDLTSTVNWTSSSPSAATVGNGSGNGGVATGIAPGSTTIAASFAGQSGTAMLAVTNATLTSIAVTPMNSSITLGNSQQFTAIGSFTPPSPNITITNQVTWSSSDPSVAVIKSSGVAVSANTGTTAIKATLDGVSETTNLTVQ